MRIPAMTITFALTLALAACGGNDNGANNNMSTNVAMTDDAAANDALGANAMAGNEAGAAMPTDANGFAAAVAATDMYEIESAQLAKTKSSSAEVKELAGHIETDHKTSTAELKTAASSAGVTVTPALDAEKQGMLDQLKAASGAEFDRVYLQQQKTAHQKALALLQGYASGGDNPALKGFASKGAKIVQGHIEHMNGLKTQ
jgi:putative membrane protein